MRIIQQEKLNNEDTIYVTLGIGGLLMTGATVVSLGYFLWLMIKTDLGFWAIVWDVVMNWLSFFFGGFALAAVGALGIANE